MSYYKYKEQEVKDTQMDWGSLGKDFRKGVDTIATERQAKRDTIEENYQTLKTKIEDESPLGSHAGTNEAMAKFSADAAQQALDMNRRMKAGDIEPSSNTAFMTNLTSSTKNMFKIGQDFNNNFDETMARHLEGGVGAAEELAYLEAAELFNNKGEPFVGKDGQVYLAARSKGGQLDFDNPISLAQAQAASTQRVDKFDMNTQSGVIANQLDVPYVKAVRSGKINSIEDARNNPAFAKALASMVDADLSTPSAMASILLDNANGYGYDLTGEHISPTTIQSQYNEESGRYEPVLTAEQEAKAKEIYENTILAQIGHKETVKPIIQQQQWQANAGAAKKKHRNTVDMASKLYSGSEDEIMAAREYFLGLNDKIKNITRTTDGVNVTYIGKDGSTTSNNISFKASSGDWKTEEDFIRSITELTGEGDVEDALKRLNLGGTTPTEHSSTEGASRTITQDIRPDADYGDLELNINGQDNLITTDSAFDNVNTEGEYMRGNTGDRVVAADGFEEVVGGIFGNLDASKTNGQIIGKTDENATAFQIYLPDVMSAPIFVPIAEGDDMLKTDMKNLTKAIYDAANNGQQISPNDLQAAMGDDIYNAQAAIYEANGLSVDDWNGGDGGVSAGGGGSSSNNSSAQFN